MLYLGTIFDLSDLGTCQGLSTVEVSKQSK